MWKFIIPVSFNHLIFLRGCINFLERMGLNFHIDLDHPFCMGTLKLRSFAHNPFFNTSPPKDDSPVTGWDDSKGSPEKDENDEKRMRTPMVLGFGPLNQMHLTFFPASFPPFEPF